LYSPLIGHFLNHSGSLREGLLAKASTNKRKKLLNIIDYQMKQPMVTPQIPPPASGARSVRSGGVCSRMPADIHVHILNILCI
jgi:hypothetical protein